MHLETKLTNRMLRDFSRRQSFAANELLRRAYKYVARNTTLPSKTRFQAQLALNTFPNKSRAEMIKNRCTATGRGRGVISEFGLCRYQVRKRGLKGELEGVHKASW